MKKITTSESVAGKVAIYAVPLSEWERRHKKTDDLFEYRFYANASKPWENGAVKVVEHDVVLPVPAGINLIEQAISTLTEAKGEVLAEAQVKLNELDKQIDKLRLLSYTPTEAQDGSDVVP